MSLEIRIDVNEANYSPEKITKIKSVMKKTLKDLKETLENNVRDLRNEYHKENNADAALNLYINIMKNFSSWIFLNLSENISIDPLILNKEIFRGIKHVISINLKERKEKKSAK